MKSSRPTIKFLIALIMAVLFINNPSFGADPEIGAQDQKPLIAIIPEDFPPTYFRDPKTGEPAGLAVDLTNELARRTGLKVEYRFGEPWEHIEQDLLAGRADLIPLRVINDKTTERFIFTKKLDATPVNYIVRSSDRDTKGASPGQKVGFIRGSTADVFLQGRQDINLFPYDSLQHLFMDLITGQLDLALTVPKNLINLARKAGVEDRVRVIEPPAFEVTRGIALRKGDVALQDRFNRAIDSLDGTPEQRTIYQRWLGKPESWWTVKHVTWIFGGLFAWLVIAFLVSRFMLMQLHTRQLKAERAFLQTMIDAIPEPVFFKNQEGVYLGCNEFFAHKFIGRPQEEIIGRTDLDIIKDRELAEFFRQKDREALAASQPSVNDEWITLADGRSILVETIKVPFRDESGEIGGLIGIAHDITARDLEKRLEETARKRLQSILNNLPILAWLKDRHGRYEMVNETFAKTFQRTVDDIIGKTDLELWSNNAEGIRSEDEQVVTESCQLQSEAEIMLASEPHWFAKYKTPIFDMHGEVSGTTGVALDITERRLAEKKLRESEQRFRDMFEKAADMILMADINTQRILMANNMACSALGYSRQEIYQLKVEDLHAAEGLAYAVGQFERLAKQNISLARDIPMRRKDGTVWYADISAFPIVMQGKSYLMGTFRDVTMRREAEMELEATRDVAEAASRAKSDFLATMSHEFRTPLNAIIGFSEILADQHFGPLNDKQARQVNHILTSGMHLLSLVNDVLDLAKVESGKMELVEAPLKISDLINHSLLMIREKAMKHGIQLDVELASELVDMTLSADERKLKQVMFNLLSNAVKFTPDGGKIKVLGKKLNGNVLISVSDTGIGIRPEDRERIFGSFEQVDSSLARQQEGTGLGLALTRRLVELHEGKIWVEDNRNAPGSVFSFTIPLESGNSSTCPANPELEESRSQI